MVLTTGHLSNPWIEDLTVVTQIKGDRSEQKSAEKIVMNVICVQTSQCGEASQERGEKKPEGKLL